MGYPRISAVAVSSLLILLTTTADAYGQRIMGGGQIGGLRGQVGGNVTAPALRGTGARPVPLRVTRGTGFGRVSVGGFPHHPVGFFVDGFGFFSGFPFFPGFAPFDPFSPDRVALFRTPRSQLGFPGVHRRRVGFFHPHPFFPFGGLFGWVPYFGASTGAEYPPASSDASVPDETTAVREVSLGQQLEVRGVAEGDTLEVERVSLMDIVPRAVLRVTWRNRDLPAAQVALFLADSSQSMLSAQTIRAPPFTALFEPNPGTAFVGMTVVWPDGTLSTRFVPYKKGPR